MKWLLNASNLHVGGGVQVATSFIDELSRIAKPAQNISLLVSDEVDGNLVRIGCDTTHFASYEVFNTYGLSSVRASWQGKFSGYDLVFTVFGPAYFLFQPFFSVVGFAQAWIIYPDNDAALKASFLNRYKYRFKYWLQSLFFRRADRLIVEAMHVKNGLVSQGFSAGHKISVVPNCISSLYFDSAKWSPLRREVAASSALRIGYVGRDYMHKNLGGLPDVRRALRECYQLDVEFYVTFSDAEWQARSDLFRTEINNVGVLEVSECPSFYQSLDAVIFPSLVECFSATPLEAMVMAKPVFASDRDFIRDICGDLVSYFDPHDINDIARVIASYFALDSQTRAAGLLAAQEHAAGFSSAQGRAQSYLEIIEDLLSGRKENGFV